MILGVVAALAAIMAGDGLAVALYPLPAGIDPHNREALEAAIRTLPTASFLIVALGWAIGGFFGPWVAATVAGRKPLVHALITGAILLHTTVSNLARVPHPTWMWAPGILVFPLGALAAARLAGSRNASAG